MSKALSCEQTQDVLKSISKIAILLEVQLTLMLLVANLGDTKLCEKSGKMTETLANGYSSESTPQELSNEYQHDRV